jgi:biopolymer transport protein TolQ
LEPAIDVYLASVRSTPADASIFELILQADLIVQLDLLILLGMSVTCWAIIVQKARRLRAASVDSARFLDVFWRTKSLDSLYEQVGTFDASPVAAVFRAGYKELQKVTAGGHTQDAAGNLTRSLRRATSAEATRLEQYVSFLATTGSTAPFIGLFGTVWGILRAFQKLGQPDAVATIQVVGPDIAHALVATAVGLVAAIPAVMAYNHFSTNIRVLKIEMENFSDDFLNIVKRHLR